MSDVHRRDVELYRGLEPVLGADVATMLLERLPPPGEELARRDDLERFPTKADLATELERFATKADLERFATKEDLEQFATKADLEAFATKADLEAFATKEDLERFATKTDLATELERYVSRDHLDLRLDAWGARLEATFQRELREAITAQTRTQLFGLAGILFATAGLAAGLGQLT